MFDNDPEMIIENQNGDTCEKCKFYILIDSGYGYCRRFPPRIENEGKWWKPKWRIRYQLTEWCRKACGEFKKN